MRYTMLEGGRFDCRLVVPLFLLIALGTYLPQTESAGWTLAVCFWTVELGKYDLCL